MKEIIKPPIKGENGVCTGTEERYAFLTGSFYFEESGHVNTSQVTHCDEEFDDDVISHDTLFMFASDIDGYVSNKGKVATIHIKDEYNTKHAIDSLKLFFQLREGPGALDKIEIVPFTKEEHEGWKARAEEFYREGYKKWKFVEITPDD